MRTKQKCVVSACPDCSGVQWHGRMGIRASVCMTLLLVDTVTLELRMKVFTKTKKTPSRAFSWLKVDIDSMVSRGEIGTPTQLS